MAFHSYAMEYHYLINDYKLVPGMDYQVELVLQNPQINHRLLLDCQSFINGLHYLKFDDAKWRDVWFMMLSGNDCEDASNFSKKSLEAGVPFCLIADPQNIDLNFDVDLRSCQ
jgi:hypothetical protein